MALKPTATEPVQETYEDRDMRCGCGRLLARLVGEGVEIKCRRCKQTRVLPLAAVQAYLALDATGSPLQAGEAAAPNLRTSCRIAGRPDGDGVGANLDRELSGSATGLPRPEGIAISRGSGHVFLAKVDGSNISLFGSAAVGNVAPLAETPSIANAWDLEYEEASDRVREGGECRSHP